MYLSLEASLSQVLLLPPFALHVFHRKLMEGVDGEGHGWKFRSSHGVAHLSNRFRVCALLRLTILTPMFSRVLHEIWIQR
jgi:hypothetical protein